MMGCGAMEFAQAPVPGHPAHAGAEVSEGDHHLTLLAATRQGYANLCRLLSYAHLNSPRGAPVLPLDTRDHTEGLIALLAALRRGGRALLQTAGKLQKMPRAAFANGSMTVFI
jgi:error-prone DNA polymerase